MDIRLHKCTGQFADAVWGLLHSHTILQLNDVHTLVKN